VSALDLLGFGFPLTGTIVLAVLVWLFRGALPVSPDDGIGGGEGGGSDRTPPGPARPWSRRGGGGSPGPHGERRDAGPGRSDRARDRSRSRVRRPR
jgi:hypothetical protein